MTGHSRSQPTSEPVRQHAPLPKLVMGEIICIGPDDEEAIPYDEAVIHLEGDEDSEIRIHCPGALRIAPQIVEAVNSHASLKAAVEAFVAAYKLQDCDNYTDELARAYSIADAALQSSGGADR